MSHDKRVTRKLLMLQHVKVESESRAYELDNLVSHCVVIIEEIAHLTCLLN